MTKSISRPGRIRARALPLFVCAVLCNCSSTGGTTSTASSGPAPAAAAETAPRPIQGDVERTTFAPELDVHLDSMTRRASGLYVQDVKFGQGGVVLRGRTVVVRYAGWLPTGKKFDAGEITVELGSGKTIPAWEEGLLGMRAGGQRRMVSPPNMAYGSRGAGDDIPPNAVLVFLMEVTSVY